MSTTAVPLRPVNKGGLAVLWIGLAVLVAAAAAWALFLSNAPQIRLETISAGRIDLVERDCIGVGFDFRSQRRIDFHGDIHGLLPCFAARRSAQHCC